MSIETHGARGSWLFGSANTPGFSDRWRGWQGGNAPAHSAGRLPWFAPTGSCLLAVLILAAGGCRASARGLGVLQAETPKFQLVLHSLAGVREVRGIEGRASLPAGTYTVMRWTAEATDRKGRRWQVRGGMWPAPIRVTAGKTTPVRIASPLRARLTATRTMERVYFRLEFSGPRGELLTGLTTDGKQPPPPRLRIRDARGRTVVELPFEYG